MMKRTLAGIGLLAVAGVGSAFLAPSSGAQEPTEPTWVQLEAHWEPNPAAPGETVTLVPDEPCPFDVDGDDVSEPGVVFIPTDDEGGGIEVPMDEDGFWSFEVTAPEEPDVYTLEAECRNSTWAEEMEFCAADEEEAPVDGDEADSFDLVSYSKPVAPAWNFFDCEFEFYSVDLTVEGDEVSPTTTTPETPVTPPPPATPIVRPPDQTG